MRTVPVQEHRSGTGHTGGRGCRVTVLDSRSCRDIPLHPPRSRGCPPCQDFSRGSRQCCHSHTDTRTGTAQHPLHSARCQSPLESPGKSAHSRLFSPCPCWHCLCSPMLLQTLQYCSQGCSELLGVHSIPPLISKKH